MVPPVEPTRVVQRENCRFDYTSYLVSLTFLAY
jgi:hypothetical protein